MQVFKLCLKILRKMIPLLMVYIIVFLTIALIMSANISEEDPQAKGFTRNKQTICLISEEESPFIDGLKQELSKVANFVNLPDETEALQDALYFRKVSYILRVPDGFTDRFLKGENVQLAKTIVPASYSSTYIDLTVSQYLSSARLYLPQINNISQEKLVENIRRDLAVGATVELMDSPEKAVNHSYANYFFNYLPYSLLSVLILGISALMLSYNDKELKRRNACSPVSSFSFNMQFILANLLFAFISWFIIVGFCIIFNLENSFNLNTLYFILNSIVFTLCGTSLSYLIGNVVTNSNAVSAVTNVVSLGLCFISGVFVPIEFLNDVVLKIASFTPTYWFVQANNRIAALTVFDFDHLKPIFTSMLNVFGFALAFLVIALIIAKRKRFE